MIQIDAGQQQKSTSESETPSETSSESPPPGPPSSTAPPNPSIASESITPAPSETEVNRGHTLVEKVDSKTLPFARQTRRELPRIATNGTLGRPQPHHQVFLLNLSMMVNEYQQILLNFHNFQMHCKNSLKLEMGFRDVIPGC